MRPYSISKSGVLWLPRYLVTPDKEMYWLPFLLNVVKISIEHTAKSQSGLVFALFGGDSQLLEQSVRKMRES